MHNQLLLFSLKYPVGVVFGVSGGDFLNLTFHFFNLFTFAKQIYYLPFGNGADISRNCIRFFQFADVQNKLKGNLPENIE